MPTVLVRNPYVVSEKERTMAVAEFKRKTYYYP